MSRELKVVLTAKEVHNCPSLRPGEQVVFQYPSLTDDCTGNPCGACLSAFMPFLIGLSKGMTFIELDGNGELNLRCPFIRQFVVFEVKMDAASPSITKVISRPSGDQDSSFIIEYLNKIPLFRPLPIESKNHIIDYLNIEKFNPGKVIIQQGNVGTHLYILLKGRVEVVKEDRSGTETVLAILDRGECFGEMSLISGEPCSATIRAQGGVSLLSINREDFEELVSNYPSLNIYFNKLLAQRLRSTNVHIEEQLEKGLMGKLNMISLAELAQTISMNQKTGTLHLTLEQEKGELYFDSGQIINAQFGDIVGEDAFFALLRWNAGSFRFVQEEPTVEPIIQWDTMGLLMEGLRRLDEEGQ